MRAAVAESSKSSDAGGTARQRQAPPTTAKPLSNHCPTTADDTADDTAAAVADVAAVADANATMFWHHDIVRLSICRCLTWKVRWQKRQGNHTAHWQKRQAQFDSYL